MHPRVDTDHVFLFARGEMNMPTMQGNHSNATSRWPLSLVVCLIAILYSCIHAGVARRLLLIYQNCHHDFRTGPGDSGVVLAVRATQMLPVVVSVGAIFLVAVHFRVVSTSLRIGLYLSYALFTLLITYAVACALL